MEFSIPPFLAYVAAWGATIGAVWFLFEKAEDTVTSETKEAISRWLRNLDPTERLSNWPSMFAAVFDRIFGERHLSWRCFWRSCIASLVAVLIMILVWSAIRPAQMATVIPGVEWDVVWMLLMVPVVLNLLPDYISLLESRYVIRLMTGRRSFLRIFVFLAIDFVVTGAIFLGVMLTVWVIIVVTQYGKPMFEVMQIGLNLILRTIIPTSTDKMWIFFYSTYFTSVWVWLFALSGLAVRLTQFFGLGVHRLKGVLDIENKPLRSMGFVSIALVTILFVVFPILR